MIRKSLILSFTFISMFTQAQSIDKCVTTEMVNKSITEDSRNYLTMKDAADKNAKWLETNRGNENKSIITVPIVIHVVHRSNHSNIGSGTNISNAQIEDGLRILNEDYSKTNPEFPNPPRNTFVQYAGNTQLQFCLATEDENGNPTTGITRTSTTETNFDVDGNDEMKRAITGGKDGWDPDKYLNIWICDIVNSGGGQILGYSYLPGSVGWSMWKDGVVVDYRYFGTIGVSAGGNDGRTPTHEIGHYLGLLHTFCQETDASGNPICCDNDDSNWGGYVDDTPATKDIYYGTVTSSTNNNTCNDLSYSNAFNTDVLDMDENFMSYASTTWMFTIEQVAVMNGTLNGYRSGLKNSTIPMNCTGTVGIENLIDNNQIKIYPNPTKGRILVQNLVNTRTKNIIVRNILGEIVYTQLSDGNITISIDLSILENGIYFIEISTDKGIRLEKVILAK